MTKLSKSQSLKVAAKAQNIRFIDNGRERLMSATADHLAISREALTDHVLGGHRAIEMDVDRENMVRDYEIRMYVGGPVWRFEVPIDFTEIATDAELRECVRAGDWGVPVSEFVDATDGVVTWAVRRQGKLYFVRVIDREVKYQTSHGTWKKAHPGCR